MKDINKRLYYGQLNDDIDELESKFNEIAELGVDYSDLWEDFENDTFCNGS